MNGNIEVFSDGTYGRRGMSVSSSQVWERACDQPLLWLQGQRRNFGLPSVSDRE